MSLGMIRVPHQPIHSSQHRIMSAGTHHRAYSNASSIPSGSGMGNDISEISPAAQLRLLRTLVEVKLDREELADNSHLNMNAITEKLFRTTSDPDRCSCLLEALGTFLTQVIGVLAQISVSLTNGPHILDYTESYIKSVAENDDLSDISIVTFLDEKLALLRYEISIEVCGNRLSGLR